MPSHLRHINPPGLGQSPVFTQVVLTQGPGTTIYIGGQNAVNQKREVIGKGNIQVQTERVMQHLLLALEAAEVTMNDLVKLTIHLVQGQDLSVAYKAAQPYLQQAVVPPAVTVLFVAGLAHPDYLIEVEAIAFKESCYTCEDPLLCEMVAYYKGIR